MKTRNKRLFACLLLGVMLLCSCKGHSGVGTESGTYETFAITSETNEYKGEQPIPTGDIKYSPQNYNMWDSWYVEKDGVIHLIHLKGLRDDLTYDTDKENQRGYGHATSLDLLHWEEQEDILMVSDTTSPNYDVDFRYTGGAIVHEGKCYVFYTMRKWGGQRIGVAWSEDMENWTQYSANPILEPDPRWFVHFNSDGFTSSESDWNAVDCRDFIVIPDPKGGGFYGYFVASAAGEYTTPCSVIGLCYSTDLLNWEQRGIVYHPGGVTMPEMVDVFEIDGKWYMTLTTAKNNGALHAFSDPYVSRAQIYAVADSPEGPFVENPADNVLIGGQYNSGYSARSILYNGKLRMMYVDSNGGRSVLSLPHDLRVNEQGYLRLYYSEDLLEVLRTKKLEPNISAQPYTSFGWNTKGGVWRKTGSTLTCTTDPNSWQAAIFDSVAKNLEMSFTLTADSDCSSFGIALSTKSDAKALEDVKYFLMLDRVHNRISLTNSTWELSNTKSFVFENNKEYKVRMLLIGNTLELYINDELAFNTGIENTGRNFAGVFAENGNVTLQDLELWRLEN